MQHGNEPHSDDENGDGDRRRRRMRRRLQEQQQVGTLGQGGRAGKTDDTGACMSRQHVSGIASADNAPPVVGCIASRSTFGRSLSPDAFFSPPMSQNGDDEYARTSTVAPEREIDATGCGSDFVISDHGAQERPSIWSIARWLGHDRKQFTDARESSLRKPSELTGNGKNCHDVIENQPQKRRPLSTLAVQQPTFPAMTSFRVHTVPWRPFVDPETNNPVRNISVLMGNGMERETRDLNDPSSIWPTSTTCADNYIRFRKCNSTSGSAMRHLANSSDIAATNNNNNNSSIATKTLSSSSDPHRQVDQRIAIQFVPYPPDRHHHHHPHLEQPLQPHRQHLSCAYCSKTYSSAGALRMHVRTHTLPCRCDVCGKAFSRPWLLHGHQRTHTGERPYACPVCRRAFADRSNLRAHLQTHDAADTRRRYACVVCRRSFSRLSLLIRHEEATAGCCGVAADARAAAVRGGQATATRTANWVQIPVGFL